MLSMKDIIKELHNLRTVRPSQDFIKSEREKLISLMEKDSAFKEVRIFNINKKRKDALLDLQKNLLYKFLRPAGVFILVVGIIAGSGVGMSFASQDSVPGDIFYPVKLTFEKAQISLQTKEEEKVKLEVEFAGRRLEELNKVKTKEILENTQESENAKIALDNYKKNIETVQKRLEVIKDKEFTKETAEVVDMVEKKTMEYSTTLKTIDNINKNSQDNSKIAPVASTTEAIEGEKIEKNIEMAVINDEKNEDFKEKIKDFNGDNENDAETKKGINEALKISEALSIKIVDIMIVKHANGEIDLSKDELMKKIKDKADSVKSKIGELEKTVQAIEEIKGEGKGDKEAELKFEAKDNDLAEQKISTSTVNLLENFEISTTTIEIIHTNLVKASSSLQIVNDLLDQGEITTAFEKIKEANGLIQDAENKLEEIMNIFKAGENESDVTSSSGEGDTKPKEQEKGTQTEEKNNSDVKEENKETKGNVDKEAKTGGPQATTTIGDMEKII